MKFIYVDESGGRDQHDVFTMCGLMVDAYKLRKKTEDFDRLLEGIFSKYPGVRKDLKTTKFINGDGEWSTPFAVRSDHSSLAQVADAISYVYRRYLEQMTMREEWPGEKKFHEGLFALLEPQRERSGRCVKGPCTDDTLHLESRGTERTLTFDRKGGGRL